MLFPNLNFLFNVSKKGLDRGSYELMSQLFWACDCVDFVQVNVDAEVQLEDESWISCTYFDSVRVEGSARMGQSESATSVLFKDTNRRSRHLKELGIRKVTTGDYSRNGFVIHSAFVAAYRVTC